MFDFDAGKLIIVGIIALIFIPPKDLPRVLRQAGQFVGKMRRMASEFQGQFMDAMREADMADLRREARELADSTKADVGYSAVRDLNTQLTDAVSSKGRSDTSKLMLEHDRAPEAAPAPSEATSPAPLPRSDDTHSDNTAPREAPLSHSA